MKSAGSVEFFPLSRRATFDVGVLGRKKHTIMGLLEVDVNEARRRLREIRRTGRQLSFLSWVLKTVGATVTAHPAVHGVFRIGVLRGILKRPTTRKKSMGTVIVTSTTAGARFAGWIVPRTIHNLALGLGSVVQKPRVVNGEVVPREVLHLTILFDHDVVDGAPAARFTSELVRDLETASELRERSMANADS